MDAAIICSSYVSSWVVVVVFIPLGVIHVPQCVAGCGPRLDVLPNLPDGIIYVVVGGVVTLTLPLLNQVSKV